MPSASASKTQGARPQVEARLVDVGELGDGTFHQVARVLQPVDRHLSFSTGDAGALQLLLFHDGIEMLAFEYPELPGAIE